MSHCGTVKLRLKWLKPLFEVLFFVFFFLCSKKFYLQVFWGAPEHSHVASGPVAALHADLLLSFSPFSRRLVTRVVNTYGPQTRGGGGQGAAGEQQVGPMARHCGNTAIEERLQNIETHLKLPEGQRTRDGNVSVGGSAAASHLQRWSGRSRIEECVPSSTAGPVPLSVYQRLKKLEDRILELEGLSPEYFQSTVSIRALGC